MVLIYLVKIHCQQLPGNPAGVEGNLVMVLVLSPALNDADTDVNVTISDFVISGTYNGQNIGLASCDADQDPFNGCFDSDSFTTPLGAASLSLANVTSSGADLMYVSNTNIYGFQFSVKGVTLTDASSELGETSFSASSGNVLGFDFSGASLPAGSGMLAHFDFEESNTSSALGLESIVLSAAMGGDISSTGPADVEVPACDVVDCNGECGGTATIDDCGVCGGDGSSCADCAGIPNGDSFLDCSNNCILDLFIMDW